MNISEKLIRENCNEVIFERGESYYKGGKVVDFSVEKEFHRGGGFTAYTIEASVEESYFDEHYVEVLFNDKSGVMSASCGCPFFIDNHRKMGFCKHVVAVLLKFFREYYKENEQSSTRNKLDKLLKDIKYTTLKLSDIKRTLKLEINYNYDLYENLSSSFEFKVGLEKTYVVKNIKQFLQAVERVQELEFGKSFVFKPLEQQFSAEDRKIIEFLLEISEIDYLIDKEEGRNSSLLTGKRVCILDRQLGRFFSLLREREIDASIQGRQFKNVRVLYEDMPLEFQMTKGREGILLDHGEDIPRPLSGNGKFFFYKGNIYAPTNEQLRLYVPLYNVFMGERSRKIQFDLGDGHRVASYLIPSLKAISKSFDLDSSMEESFYEAPLITRIYLDKNFKGITAEVKFCYGDVEISALQDETVEGKDGILLRDISGEALVISGIESFGFRRDAENFRMENEEDLMQFLVEGADKLKEFSEVYYSDAFRNMRIYNSSSVVGGIRVNSEDLLEFTFGMEDINPREMKSILQAVRQKKKYYRLKDGGFVDLQDQGIKDVVGILDYLNINEKEFFSKGSTVISRYNALFIDG
ncbi:MAG: SNF2 helicase associated domain-containing protein, partial [Bacillota bacterium]|nr:SNF2 helicase associated domain-containing protein [Bacillota bacterium]